MTPASPATSSAPPATASAPGAPDAPHAPDEPARLRAENERLAAEVRDLYARLAGVHADHARLAEAQRSLETLIVAGVAALEAVDRLGLRAEPATTQQSPSLLAWLRGVLVKRPAEGRDRAAEGRDRH